MSGVTPDSTVGAITLPSAVPPARTSAPLDRASSTRPMMRSRAPSPITGPIIVPWSRGSPVVSRPARAARRAAAAARPPPGGGGEPLTEVARDGPVDHDALRRHADLSRVHEGAEAR